MKLLQKNKQAPNEPETLLALVPPCLTGPVLVQIYLVPAAQPESRKPECMVIAVVLHISLV